MKLADHHLGLDAKLWLVLYSLTRPHVKVPRGYRTRTRVWERITHESSPAGFELLVHHNTSGVQLRVKWEMFPGGDIRVRSWLDIPGQPQGGGPVNDHLCATVSVATVHIEETVERFYVDRSLSRR